jgi:hypothetical protein
MAESRRLLGGYTHQLIHNGHLGMLPTLQVEIITLKSITGDVVASSTSDYRSTVVNKVITPYALSQILASPFPIGSEEPNTGAFTTLHANSLSLTDPLSPYSGGTGNRCYTKGDLLVATGSNSIEKLSVGSNGQVLTADNCSPGGVTWRNSGVPSLPLTVDNGGTSYTNYTKGDILVATGSTVLEKLSVGSDGQVLTADNNTPGGVAWRNNVTVPSFPLSLGNGGTSFTSYTKGDLLVATASDALEKLPVGSANQVLTVDTNAAGGISWKTPQMPQPGPEAVGYVNIGNPIPDINYGTNSLYYVMPYCYCESHNTYDNTPNISINIEWPQILYPSYGQINGFELTDALGVDATSSGTSVYASGIHNYFNYGDVISINMGEGYYSRRVIEVMEGTVVVDVSFPTEFEYCSYYRGGVAPNAMYYLYAVGDSNGTNQPGYLLSTRAFTVIGYQPHLPSGYNKFRMLWPVFWYW